MDMEDMRTDPMIYIDKEQLVKGVLESLPTLAWVWLFADYFGKQDEKTQFEMLKEIEEFQKFGGNQ